MQTRNRVHPVSAADLEEDEDFGRSRTPPAHMQHLTAGAAQTPPRSAIKAAVGDTLPTAAPPDADPPTVSALAKKISRGIVLAAAVVHAALCSCSRDSEFMCVQPSHHLIYSTFTPAPAAPYRSPFPPRVLGAPGALTLVTRPWPPLGDEQRGHPVGKREREAGVRVGACGTHGRQRASASATQPRDGHGARAAPCTLLASPRTLSALLP